MIFAHNMSPDELVRLKECQFCKIFIPQENIDKYRISKDSNDTLECKDCKTLFLNEKLLESHWRIVHRTK